MQNSMSSKKTGCCLLTLRLLRFGLEPCWHVPARVEKPKLNECRCVHALNSAINLLDDYVVIPSAIGSLLTVCWLLGLGVSSSIGDCEMDCNHCPNRLWYVWLFPWEMQPQFLRLNDWKLWKIRSITLMPEA